MAARRAQFLTGSLALLLAACGGSGDDGPGIEVGSLEVQGRVVDFAGRGAPNIGVVVDGRGPFLTDENGRFVVKAVRPPYWTVLLIGATGSADVWVGLTRADPQFTIEAFDPGSLSQTSFSGTLSGGAGFPLPANQDAIVLYEDDVSLFPLARTDVDPTTGLYDETSLQWVGPSPTDVTVHGLQYEVDADGRPVQFTGHGTLQAVAATGLPYVNQDVVLGAVPTTTVSGEMVLPAGLNLVARYSLLRPNARTLMPLTFDQVQTTTFSLAYPDVAGLERSALFLAGVEFGASVAVLREQLPAPTANLTVTLSAATQLALPIDGAAGVGYDTDFLVTPSPGDRVFRATWQPSGDAGPTIRLFTTEAVFRIPDLRDYGVALPPGALYEWTVDAFGPATAVDDVAVLVTLGLLYEFYGGDGAFRASGGDWTFFFQP